GVEHALSVADTRGSFPQIDGILRRVFDTPGSQRALTLLVGLKLNPDEEVTRADSLRLYLCATQAVEKARQLGADLAGRADRLGHVGAAEAVGRVAPVPAAQVGLRPPQRDRLVAVLGVVVHHALR